jgi:hypothetical protein
MSTQAENASDQSAAFQKIWTESITKLMQAASVFTPGSAPPELLRDIRSGILNALAKSWDEFLRSPQFQEAMKQWMDQAIAFRKMSHDLMGKVRKEMQAPSRDDIDAIMLSMRHMETRILDRLETLEKQLNGAQNGFARPPTSARGKSTRKRPARKSRSISRRSS